MLGTEGRAEQNRVAADVRVVNKQNNQEYQLNLNRLIEVCGRN
jgi:hypothetical protein